MKCPRCDGYKRIPVPGTDFGETTCPECRGSGVSTPQERCPFCGDRDFDLPGLKWHLSRCDAYIQINIKGDQFRSLPLR